MRLKDITTRSQTESNLQDVPNDVQQYIVDVLSPIRRENNIANVCSDLMDLSIGELILVAISHKIGTGGRADLGTFLGTGHEISTIRPDCLSGYANRNSGSGDYWSGVISSAINQAINCRLERSGIEYPQFNAYCTVSLTANGIGVVIDTDDETVIDQSISKDRLVELLGQSHYSTLVRVLYIVSHYDGSFPVQFVSKLDIACTDASLAIAEFRSAIAEKKERE